MNHCRHIAVAALCLGLLSGVAQARQDRPATSEQSLFHVVLGPASSQPTAGRLLLFAIDAKTAEAAAKAESAGSGGKVEEVDADPFSANQTSVAAREVSRLAPGQGVDIDADTLAFPAGYSKLPPGDYLVQAVLDVDHSYNYSGRGAGDLVSDVVKVHLPATDVPALTLVKQLPARAPWTFPARAMSADSMKYLDEAKVHTQPIDFTSRHSPRSGAARLACMAGS